MNTKLKDLLYNTSNENMHRIFEETDVENKENNNKEQEEVDNIQSLSAATLSIIEKFIAQKVNSVLPDFKSSLVDIANDLSDKEASDALGPLSRKILNTLSGIQIKNLQIDPMEIKGEQEEGFDPVSFPFYERMQLIPVFITNKSDQPLGGSKSGKEFAAIFYIPAMHTPILKDNQRLHSMMFDVPMPDQVTGKDSETGEETSAEIMIHMNLKKLHPQMITKEEMPVIQDAFKNNKDTFLAQIEKKSSTRNPTGPNEKPAEAKKSNESFVYQQGLTLLAEAFTDTESSETVETFYADRAAFEELIKKAAGEEEKDASKDDRTNDVKHVLDELQKSLDPDKLSLTGVDSFKLGPVSKGSAKYFIEVKLEGGKPAIYLQTSQNKKDKVENNQIDKSLRKDLIVTIGKLISNKSTASFVNAVSPKEAAINAFNNLFKNSGFDYEKIEPHVQSAATSRKNKKAKEEKEKHIELINNILDESDAFGQDLPEDSSIDKPEKIVLFESSLSDNSVLLDFKTTELVLKENSSKTNLNLSEKEKKELSQKFIKRLSEIVDSQKLEIIINDMLADKWTSDDTDRDNSVDSELFGLLERFAGKREEVTGDLQSKINEEISNRIKVINSIKPNMQKDLTDIFAPLSKLGLTIPDNAIEDKITIESKEVREYEQDLNDFANELFKKARSTDADQESISAQIREKIKSEMVPSNIDIDDFVNDVFTDNVLDGLNIDDFVDAFANRAFRLSDSERIGLVDELDDEQVKQLIIDAYYDFTGFGKQSVGSSVIKSHYEIKNKNLLSEKYLREERLLQEGIGGFIATFKGVMLGSAAGALVAAAVGLTGFVPVALFIVGGSFVGARLGEKVGKMLDNIPLIDSLNTAGLSRLKTPEELSAAILGERKVLDPAFTAIIKVLIAEEVKATVKQYFLSIHGILEECNVKLSENGSEVAEEEIQKAKTETEESERFDDLNDEAQAFVEALYNVPMQVSKGMGPLYKDKINYSTSKLIMDRVLKKTPGLSDIITAYVSRNKREEESEEKLTTDGYIYMQGLSMLLEKSEAEGFRKKAGKQKAVTIDAEELFEKIKLDIANYIKEVVDLKKEGINQLFKYLKSKGQLKQAVENEIGKKIVSKIGADSFNEEMLKKSHAIAALSKVTGIPSSKFSQLFVTESFAKNLPLLVEEKSSHPIYLNEPVLTGNVSSYLFKDIEFKKHIRKTENKKDYIKESLILGNLSSLLLEEAGEETSSTWWQLKHEAVPFSFNPEIITKDQMAQQLTSYFKIFGKDFDLSSISNEVNGGMAEISSFLNAYDNDPAKLLKLYNYINGVKFTEGQIELSDAHKAFIKPGTYGDKSIFDYIKKETDWNDGTGKILNQLNIDKNGDVTYNTSPPNTLSGGQAGVQQDAQEMEQVLLGDNIKLSSRLDKPITPGKTSADATSSPDEEAVVIPVTSTVSPEQGKVIDKVEKASGGKVTLEKDEEGFKVTFETATKKIEAVGKTISETWDEFTTTATPYLEKLSGGLAKDWEILFGSKALRASAEAKRSEISDTQKAIEKAKQGYTNPNEIASADNALKSLEAQLNALEQNPQIDQTVNNLTQELSGLHKQIILAKSSGADTAGLQSQIDNTGKQIKDLLGAKSRESFEAIQQQLKASEDLIAASEKYRIANEDKIEAEKLLKNDENLFDNAKKDLAIATEKLEVAKSGGAEQIKQAESAVEKAKKGLEKIKLDAQKTDGFTKFESAEDKINDLNRQAQQLQDKIKQLETQQSGDKALEAKKTIFASKSDEMETLQDKVGSPDVTDSDIQSDIQQLNKVSTEVDKLAKEIQTAEKVNNDLHTKQTELKTVKSKISTEESTIKTHRAMHDQYETQIEDAEGKVQRLETQLKSAKESVGKATSAAQKDFDQEKGDFDQAQEDFDTAKSASAASAEDADADGTFSDDTPDQAAQAAREKAEEALQKLKDAINPQSGEALSTADQDKALENLKQQIKSQEENLDKLKSNVEGGSSENAERISGEVSQYEESILNIKAELTAMKEEGLFGELNDYVVGKVESLTAYATNVGDKIDAFQGQLTSLTGEKFGFNHFNNAEDSLSSTAGLSLDLIPYAIWGFKAYKAFQKSAKEHIHRESLESALADESSNVFDYGLSTPIAYTIVTFLTEQKEVLKNLGFEVKGQLPRGKDSENLMSKESSGDVSELFSQEMHDMTKEKLKDAKANSILGKIFGAKPVSDEDLIAGMEKELKDAIGTTLTGLMLNYDSKRAAELKSKTNANIKKYNTDTRSLAEKSRSVGKYGGGAAAATIGLALGTGGLALPLLFAYGGYKLATSDLASSVTEFAAEESFKAIRNTRKESGMRDFDNVLQSDPAVKKDVAAILSIVKSTSKKIKKIQDSYKRMHKNKLSKLLFESDQKTITTKDIKRKLESQGVSIYGYMSSADKNFAGAEAHLLSKIANIFESYFGIQIPDVPKSELGDQIEAQSRVQQTVDSSAKVGQPSNPHIVNNLSDIPMHSGPNDPINPAQFMHAAAYSGGQNNSAIATLIVQQNEMMMKMFEKMMQGQMTMPQAAQQVQQIAGDKVSNLDASLDKALKVIRANTPTISKEDAKMIYYTIKSDSLKNVINDLNQKARAIRNQTSDQSGKDINVSDYKDLDEGAYARAIKQRFNIIDDDQSAGNKAIDALTQFLMIEILGIDSDYVVIGEKAKYINLSTVSDFIKQISKKLLKGKPSINNSPHKDIQNDKGKKAKLANNNNNAEKIINKMTIKTENRFVNKKVIKRKKSFDIINEEMYHKQRLSHLLFEENKIINTDRRKKKSSVDLSSEWRRIWNIDQ